MDGKGLELCAQLFPKAEKLKLEGEKFFPDLLTITGNFTIIHVLSCRCLSETNTL
jgi:hypothetical protein